MKNAKPIGSIFQKLNVIMEMDICISVLTTGLALLQRDKHAVRKHFNFLLLLSTGMERLLKLLFIIKKYDTTGELVANQELKKYGHNIEKLYDDYITLVNPCITRVPAIVEDERFMKEDQLLRALIKLFSDFGTSERYIYMDGITTHEKNFTTFDRRWEEVESIALPDFPNEKLIEPNGYLEFMRTATERIVICFERLLRALARTIVFSNSSVESRSLTSQFMAFAHYDERQFGKKLYEI